LRIIDLEMLIQNFINFIDLHVSVISIRGIGGVKPVQRLQFLKKMKLQFYFWRKSYGFRNSYPSAQLIVDLSE
jgi:hypothetical protein